MAHTVFVDGSTVTANRIVAAWLNDADTVTYVRFGDGTSYTGNLTVPGTTSLTGTLTAAAINASGIISAPVGSVGSPSFSFTGDTTTGMYRAGVNNGALVTNGGIRLQWDGTSVYVNNLVIDIANANANISRLGAGSLAIGTGAIGSTAGSLSLTSLTASGTSTMAAINASGNISVSKATALLDVNATGNTSSVVYASQIVGNGNASFYARATGGNGYGAILNLESKTTGGVLNTWSIGTGITGGTNALEFYDTAQRLRIDVGGAVTIPGTLGVGDITTNGNNKGLYFNGTRNGILGSNAADTVSIAAANANVAVFGAASTSLTGTLGLSGLLNVTTNNIYMTQKDSGGTQRAIMGLGNDNNLYIGDLGTFGGGMRFGANGIYVGAITASGYSKFSNTGTFVNIAGPYHEMQHNANSLITQFSNSNATLNSTINGIGMYYSGGAPNSTAACFLYNEDTGGQRSAFRSNGGLANYSANDVNLSDETVKSDFIPMPSFRDEFAAMHGKWTRYKYTDQTHTDYNSGYRAQDIREVFGAKAPELVDWWATEQRIEVEDAETGEKSNKMVPIPESERKLAVYNDDLHNIAMSVLSELIIEQNALRSEFQSYKSSHP